VVFEENDFQPIREGYLGYVIRKRRSGRRKQEQNACGAKTDEQ
jgi:hypothetical protein